MNLYEKIKDIISLVGTATNVDLARKLQEALKESRALEEENAELKARLHLEGEMRLDPEKKEWYRHVDGGEPEGPYCSKCWEGSGRLTHYREDGSYWKCPVCGDKVLQSGKERPPTVQILALG